MMIAIPPRKGPAGDERSAIAYTAGAKYHHRLELGDANSVPVDVVKSGTNRHRLRDYALYLLISFLIVGLSLTALFMDVPWEAYIRWFAFVIATAVLFGQFIGSSLSMWHLRSFRTFTGVLLSIHVAFGVFVLLKGHGSVHIVWAYLLEAIVIFYGRDFFLRQKG